MKGTSPITCMHNKQHNVTQYEVMTVEISDFNGKTSITYILRAKKFDSYVPSPFPNPHIHGANTYGQKQILIVVKERC